MAAPDNDSYDRLFFEFERTEPRASYLVCSIPRSGSSLLCELLASTGLAGAPAEFFHPDKMEVLQRRWGVDELDDYLRELLARKTSPNGVFGTKAHWGQYQPLFGESDPRTVLPEPCARCSSPAGTGCARRCPGCGRCRRSSGSTQDGPRVERPEVFDHEHITQKLGRIDREEEVWESLFDRHGIEPHRVVYEDFVEAQEETVRAVLDALGVDAARRPAPPSPRARTARPTSDPTSGSSGTASVAPVRPAALESSERA